VTTERKRNPFARLFLPGIFKSDQWQALDKTERALLYVLLLRATDEYVSWPSHKEIEQASGYKRVSIIRAIDRLVSKGAIRIEQRNGMRNRYHIDTWKPENMNTPGGNSDEEGFRKELLAAINTLEAHPQADNTDTDAIVALAFNKN